MSAITVGGDLVHYEVLGRGRPVILVHGWLGSWRYWIPTMQQLHLKYRVYALDLFGFGDSGKNPEKYTLQHQVELLGEFMKQLGIAKAAMIGHGLGAMVVSEFASNNTDKIARLLLASAPLFDPGDLDQRTPAGQRRLLTVDSAQINALSETPVQPPATPAPPATDSEKPAETAPGASTDPTVVNRSTPPTSTTTETIMRKPDSSHMMPTVPRVSSDARARLEAAAKAAAAAATATTATPTPSPQPAAAETPVKLPLTSLALKDNNPLRDTFAESNPEALLGMCFKTGEAEYEKLRVDVVKADALALKRSISTFEAGHMLDVLRLLPMPVVLVHGVDDPIIKQPGENIWHYLTLGKDDLLMPVPLPGVRHFPMLESDTFNRLANQFLEIPEISQLEIKERWTRRTR